ncbi:hypothetical protein [Paenibacillus sp. Root444D2]|uniref:hypothetical protein n=1 Tax=Paenibacillus sp. Root444D2 TaxID=1736538 RepID=UPI00070FC4CA|nr:hypothetical protein [Paenibacillus sp. Root444D2]KQX48706.1 hypothetical protein ASD40_11055 [Paenibacillus sp. Root444D2]
MVIWHADYGRIYYYDEERERELEKKWGMQAYERQKNKEQKLLDERAKRMKGTLEDWLGMNDPKVFIDYVSLECGCIDQVPDFIVYECTWGDEDGEEPKFFCPECNGTGKKGKAS